MSYIVGTADIVRLFGVQGIVFFPREARSAAVEQPVYADFLYEVGLPHTDFFASRIDSGSLGEDPALLGEALARQQLPCPPEAEKWWVLGYFMDSLLALDPLTGRVHAFPEGTDRFFLIHRDVESLVHALCLLQGFYREKDAVDDEDALVAEMRTKIERFDCAPFLDPLSEWRIIYDEILEGPW